jgi:hypothetical protein
LAIFFIRGLRFVHRNEASRVYTDLPAGLPIAVVNSGYHIYLQPESADSAIQ